MEVQHPQGQSQQDTGYCNALQGSSFQKAQAQDKCFLIKPGLVDMKRKHNEKLLYIN